MLFRGARLGRCPQPQARALARVGGGRYNRVMSKTVAVIGASSNREKFGNKALRAFERQGYVVIPINPTEAMVEGHKAYKSVLDVPGSIDMATVYVPPRAGVRIMEELAAKGIAEVWLNPGADGPDVVDRARALGLKTIQACSIIAIGDSPARY
jgi:predicted CoA-binding protein